MVLLWFMYGFLLCKYVVINVLNSDVGVYSILVYDAHTRKYPFCIFCLNPTWPYIWNFSFLVINALTFFFFKKKVKNSCIVEVDFLIINMLKITKNWKRCQKVIFYSKSIYYFPLFFLFLVYFTSVTLCFLLSYLIFTLYSIYSIVM